MNGGTALCERRRQTDHDLTLERENSDIELRLLANTNLNQFRGLLKI
jgi:hypothetical protein